MQLITRLCLRIDREAGGIKNAGKKAIIENSNSVVSSSNNGNCDENSTQKWQRFAFRAKECRKVEPYGILNCMFIKSFHEFNALSSHTHTATHTYESQMLSNRIFVIAKHTSFYIFGYDNETVFFSVLLSHIHNVDMIGCYGWLLITLARFVNQLPFGWSEWEKNDFIFKFVKQMIICVWNFFSPKFLLSPIFFSFVRVFLGLPFLHWFVLNV